MLKAKSTAHNRIVCARRLTAAGLQKTAVGLAPFMRFSVATFFCARGNATHCLLIGRKKTSHTTGTLCAIKNKKLRNAPRPCGAKKKY